jgi:2-amino-4-hydroxy-6-hydroxymethyldihydropteridine diphosphokinase
VSDQLALFSYLVSVGSNLGDRRETVDRALAMISERGLTIDAKSELVDTSPIGAADKVFLNGAFICTGDINPDDFMRLLLDVETRLGRVRDVRWGNRTIDLDVLLIRNESGESVECNSSLLTVPHPRMLERDFMLRPAAAVAGHWVLPFSDQNLRALCVSRGWRPAWNNLKGNIKLWQALKGDVYSATTSRLWWPVLIGMLCLRLWSATHIPFGNDEAYYWDWGRSPQLSFFDHPPFVAWIAWLSRLLTFTWLDGPIQGRLLVPLLHLATTLMFGALVVRLTRRVLTTMESRAVILVSQFVPAFSLGGIMLMPDVGLILFSTAAVWFVLAISRRDHLPWWSGVILGLLLGGAGISKYHAALIGGGLLAWLFWKRQESFTKELPFWISVMISGLVTISPVVLWNATNDWASFRYQAGRGVAGGGVSMTRALRTLAGEAVFLGPAVLIGVWLAWKTRRKTWKDEGSILLWTALPMLVVLKIFSFTSQTLPHWSMPSFWLLCAIIIPVLADSAAMRWTARIYGVVFCVFLPLFMSSDVARRTLLRWTGDRPGPLGEMTLWENASRDRVITGYIFDRAWIGEGSTEARTCDRGPVFAAPRWFTVAQVAANLPGNPLVESLDQDHRSYYHYRPKGPVVGCYVVILSEKSHWRDDGWSGSIRIIDKREFEVDGHRDRKIVIGRGIIEADPLSF